MPVVRGHTIPPLYVADGVSAPRTPPRAPRPLPRGVVPPPRRAGGAGPIGIGFLGAFTRLTALILVGWIAFWAVTQIVNVAQDGISWARAAWSDFLKDDSGCGTTTAGTTYWVRRGDTLSGIAQARGLTLRELMATGNNACRFRNPDRIFPGQPVDLPRRGGSR